MSTVRQLLAEVNVNDKGRAMGRKLSDWVNLRVNGVKADVMKSGDGWMVSFDMTYGDLEIIYKDGPNGIERDEVIVPARLMKKLSPQVRKRVHDFLMSNSGVIDTIVSFKSEPGIIGGLVRAIQDDIY